MKALKLAGIHKNASTEKNIVSHPANTNSTLPLAKSNNYKLK